MSIFTGGFGFQVTQSRIPSSAPSDSTGAPSSGFLNSFVGYCKGCSGEKIADKFLAILLIGAGLFCILNIPGVVVTGSLLLLLGVVYFCSDFCELSNTNSELATTSSDVRDGNTINFWLPPKNACSDYANLYHVLGIETVDTLGRGSAPTARPKFRQPGEKPKVDAFVLENTVGRTALRQALRTNGFAMVELVGFANDPAIFLRSDLLKVDDITYEMIGGVRTAVISGQFKSSNGPFKFNWSQR